LGKIYISLQQNVEAEKQLDQAIQADTQDASALYYLGALLVQSARYQEGLPYLQKAQGMTPDAWATYFYMGKAELQLHHTDRAVPLLRRAADMNPDDSGAFYLLARALRSEGRTQDADAAMHRVIELHTTAIDAERRALKDAHIVIER
jgi:tetratricopeptide (TPR) repeat protein